MRGRWPLLGALAASVACVIACGGAGPDASPPAGQAPGQPSPAVPSPGLPVAPGQNVEVTLGGRRWLLYVPASAQAQARALPVVFMLHGFGATPELTIAYDTLGRWNELAERDRFIVVYPQAADAAWASCTGNADLEFFDAMLSVLGASYDIDRQRVYAAGHSMGGQMALRLALDRSGTYAAVMANEAPAAACGAGGAAVPVLLTYGTADPLVGYEGNAATTLDFWLARNRAGLPPQVARLEDRVPEDLGTIDESRYAPTPGGADVVFWRMNGSGHAWPNPTAYPAALQAQFGPRNQDVDAADAAWAFFQAHPRR